MPDLPRACRSVPWVYAPVVGAALAIAVWLGAAGVAGEKQPAASAPALAAAELRVAVVDMERVLAGSREWQDNVAERSRMQETARRTLTKLARENQVLRNEYENLPPGTDERQAKAAEVDAALRRYQQTEQELEGAIARRHEEAVRNLFGKLSRVVAAYAREHGISLVLKKQSIDVTEPQTPEQSLQMATMDVLYADPALDISADVVELLNAQYSGPIEEK
jgi:Skp family chaperone for outer membrane proteins